MKDIILNQDVTWTNVGDKVLTTDGDFTDGTNIDTTIRVLIELVSAATSEVQKAIQGLAENSSHVLTTLKNYTIKEEDLIISGNDTYSVNYVIPNQFNIDYSIYLLKIYN